MKQVNESDMELKETVIRILGDAQRDFLKPPTPELGNGFGLCGYIMRHPLARDRGMRLCHYLGLDVLQYMFCGGRRQYDAYEHLAKGYKTERSDWCAKKIKELESTGHCKDQPIYKHNLIHESGYAYCEDCGQTFWPEDFEDLEAK